MDAQQPDLARERRRKIVISTVVFFILLTAALLWWFRYWPQERIADQFFAALEKQQYETAYAIYFHDPNWRQHPQEHKQYPYNEFYTDWGPGGEWGLIKDYRIEASGNCPMPGSGVIVQVIVNGRAERARVYVDKRDKTVSSPPC